MTYAAEVVEVDISILDPVELEGKRYIAASRLGDWIRRFSGLTGEIAHPYEGGNSYEVSLLEFADRDPDTTWIQVIVP